MRQLNLKVWRNKTFVIIEITKDFDCASRLFKNSVFCQSTDLLDKTGVEIYEGDYLFDLEFDEYGNNISSKHPVVWNNENASFCADTSFKKDGSWLVGILDYFTIEQL